MLTRSATVYFVRTAITPIPAGAIAIAFCWLMECAQLTPVPAALSARSLLARYVFGVTFDPVDLAWYPVGVVLPVAAHLLIRHRRRPVTHSPEVVVD